jgi:hypothetical protein
MDIASRASSTLSSGRKRLSSASIAVCMTAGFADLPRSRTTFRGQPVARGIPLLPGERIADGRRPGGEQAHPALEAREHGPVVLGGEAGEGRR